MLDARFSHLYFYQSLNRPQRGLSAIAELLVLFSTSPPYEHTYFYLCPFFCVPCFSMETSAIDLKLQHNVSVLVTAFSLEIWPTVTKLDPFELKMVRSTPICQKNDAVSLQLQRWYYATPTHRREVGWQTIAAATSPLADRTVHNVDLTVSSRKKM